MVLEAMMSVRDAVKSPWHMVIFGAVISLISLGISSFTFPEYAGLMTVFLITIISAPFMWNLFKYEEWCEEKDFVCKMRFSDKVNPAKVFARSSRIFLVYSAFFAGMVIALSLAFVLLPEDVAERVFDNQRGQIEKISNIFEGRAVLGGTFSQILYNNLIVLSVSFLFALLFGIGAIFILSWNASVLAAAIGIVAKTSGVPTALLTFLPHGVFEIAAYFLAAIAGGVISAAVIKHRTPQFVPVMRDMSLMIALSIALIAVGAYIEGFQATL